MGGLSAEVKFEDQLIYIKATYLYLITQAKDWHK